jgi:hypothetical protein
MSTPPVRHLRAGPLTLELADGGLRYVRYGEREVLRRLYVAVRDARWVSVPGTIERADVDERDDGFEATLEVRHELGPVSFRWRGILRGDPAGVVSFRMEGEARSTFLRNRIGICVLHPVLECAGRPCRVEHADGGASDGSFPGLISPHQPFFDIRALRHEVEPGVRADVRFAGEVFEMEDQRNWSDASFKTYSGPLALPRPVEVRAGTRIVQEVTLTLTGAGRSTS